MWQWSWWLLSLELDDSNLDIPHRSYLRAIQEPFRLVTSLSEREMNFGTRLSRCPVQRDWCKLWDFGRGWKTEDPARPARPAGASVIDRLAKKSAASLFSRWRRSSSAYYVVVGNIRGSIRLPKHDRGQSSTNYDEGGSLELDTQIENVRFKMMYYS